MTRGDEALRSSAARGPLSSRLRLHVAAAILGVLLASPASAAPGVSTTKFAEMPTGTYGSDHAHTSVVARLSHMGYSSYTLRFAKALAEYRFDPAAPEASRITATIDPASIDTGSKSFDQELAGKGWFDVKTYPEITFASSHIDIGDGMHGRVDGDLTLHGVTRPVTLMVTFNGVGGDLIPLVTRSGFSASATIKRSDFGIDRYEGLVGDEVQLVIEIEFTRKILS